MIVVRDSHIVFSNEECLRNFSLLSAGSSIDSLSAVKSLDGQKSVAEVIISPSALTRAASERFVYDGVPPAERKYFTLRHSSITFQSLPSTAVILQDQTSYEQLKCLDEKYQRLYLASVVHDIRTPLNGILGMLDVIEQTCGESTRAVISQYINVAKCSAKLLLFLTYDITDFSQIEANVITIVHESFSPCDVINESIQLLGFAFQRKGIQLVNTVEANVPATVVSDRNRYMQILLNLLGNALKFTFKGAVKTSLRYQPANDLLVTSVEDSGIGIKEEDMPRLFRIFGKIRESSELNPTGVGLGLTICKKLSERMGGETTVESYFGRGSTFTFSIRCNLARKAHLEAEKSAMASYSEIPAGFAEERGVEISRADDSHNFIAVIHNNPMYSPTQIMLGQVPNSGRVCECCVTTYTNRTREEKC
ncbi:MAG: HAMP domain-containing sensor histidine kinase [Candidatus Pacebacteria bacterium]|nr:HAMP domain-containing sensor histidine kinase [Candidatus Paceibacterota bacterium]